MLVIVVGGELRVLQVMGNATAGFVNARGAGAEHNPDPARAVGLDGLTNLIFNLQRRFQQQLVIATALLGQFRGQARQFAVYGGHRHDALRHPAAFGTHARAVAGKQLAADLRLATAKGADHAKGIEVGGHRLTPNGVMR